MVKLFFPFCRFFLLCFLSMYTLFGQTSFSVLWETQPIAGQPIHALLMISHDPLEKIDPQSFRSSNTALQVTLVEQKTLSDGKVQSIYRLTLPAQEAGLHLLSSIQFSIHGKVFQTGEIAYEVKSPFQRTAGEMPVGETVLQLKTFVEKKGSLYPGQTIEVGYLYIYNDTIELTQETLPLLHPKGFIPIGPPVARSFQQGGNMVREVRQTLRAEVPGIYQVGPSKVEGYVYRISSGGKKSFIGSKLSSEASGVSLEISSFPEKGQPPSFNGAVGSALSLQAYAQGFTEITLGNTISVTFLISGAGDVQNAPLPQLCCQPGFPGRIEEADMPVVETFKEGKKYIVVDLKPLSTSVKEIPSVQYSFFDPEAMSYKTVQTDPIPITVIAKEGKQEISPRAKDQNTEFWSQPDTTQQEEQSLQKEGNGLFQLVFMLLAATIMTLTAYFLYYKQKLQIQPLEKEALAKLNSEKILEEALKAHTEGSFVAGLQRAFLLRLEELEEIPSSAISWKDLPDKGRSKEVKEFFFSIEQERFSRGRSMNREQVAQNAKQIFYSLS